MREGDGVVERSVAAKEIAARVLRPLCNGMRSLPISIPEAVALEPNVTGK
jgi:hypothetical protein